MTLRCLAEASIFLNIYYLHIEYMRYISSDNWYNQNHTEVLKLVEPLKNEKITLVMTKELVLL